MHSLLYSARINLVSTHSQNICTNVFQRLHNNMEEWVSEWVNRPNHASTMQFQAIIRLVETVRLQSCWSLYIDLLIPLRCWRNLFVLINNKILNGFHSMVYFRYRLLTVYQYTLFTKHGVKCEKLSTAVFDFSHFKFEDPKNGSQLHKKNLENWRIDDTTTT